MRQIDALTARSQAFLENAERQIEGWDGRRIVERIEALVRRQDDWRGRCLNLNPAESLMSRRSRALLDSDMATRLTEGVPGDKLYPHGRSNENFDEIEAVIIALARRQYGAEFVEWRPVSTTMANTAVFHAALKPGDVMLSQADQGGGNYVYQASGPPGLMGVEVRSIPWRGDTFEIDLEALSDLVDRHRPKLIAVGGSNVLFPYPLAEMRRIADRSGAVILYDAAHLSLLVSAGDFQKPLEEGADVVTFSTSKILGGPVGGLALTNDPVLADALLKVTFPALLQTRDLNKLAALAVAMAENETFGAARAVQSVRNAQALAGALEAEGFEVLAADRGHTRTHQIFLRLGDSAKTFETRCNDAGIMLTDCALSGEATAGKRGGSRLATHEITRQGMAEPEMAEVASLIGRAFRGEDSECVRAEVEALVGRFSTIAYGFDDER